MYPFGFGGPRNVHVKPVLLQCSVLLAVGSHKDYTIYMRAHHANSQPTRFSLKVTLDIGIGPGTNQSAGTC